MKYIKQLESSPRGIYCGAIGPLLPTEDDKMIFNIPIRTIEYKYGQTDFMESEQVLQLILSQKMK